MEDSIILFKDHLFYQQLKMLVTKKNQRIACKNQKKGKLGHFNSRLISAILDKKKTNKNQKSPLNLQKGGHQKMGTRKSSQMGSPKSTQFF